MTSDYKVKVVSILQQHDLTWSVECLVDMKTTLGVDMGHMSSIQLGIWIVIDHTDHINPGNEDVLIVVPTPSKVEAVESNQKKSNNVLYMFQLNTPLIKKGSLLKHMVGVLQ